MIVEGWLEHGEARLHYVQAENGSHLTPLIYVPGSLGNADDFRSEMERLAPRPTIAISPRGLGKSSAPASGYSFAHLTSDLEAVLDHLSLPPACIMAFSLGVPVALGYSVKNPASVRGLILLDYPARYPKYSSAWVDRALSFARHRGIPEHVVHRLQEASKSVELWDELHVLNCPVLIIKGGRSRSITESDLDRYREVLPQAHVEIFDNSAHEVFRPDYERFMQTVERFLESLDRAPRSTR